MYGKISKILFKVFSSILLIAIFAVLATSVSLIYSFGECRPFRGPDIFDPYANINGGGDFYGKELISTHIQK